MRKRFVGKLALSVVGCMLFAAGWVLGQGKAGTQKTVIHAAAWSSVDKMTREQFEKYKAAMAATVGTVPGLKRVWVGKLEKPITGDGFKRDYGLVFEFESAKSFEDYAKVHKGLPFYPVSHALRKPGSGATMFQVVGE